MRKTVMPPPVKTKSKSQTFNDNNEGISNQNKREDTQEEISTVTETAPLTAKNNALIHRQSNKAILIDVSRKSFSFAFVSLANVADSYANTKFVASLGSEALAATFLIETSLNLLMGIYISLEQPVAVLSSNYDGKIKQLRRQGADDLAISRVEHAIGEVVQLGWLVGAGLCVPLALIFWNMKPILISLGQNETSSELVKQFMHYFVFSLPFRVMNGVTTNLVAATNREWLLIPYYIITLGIGIGTGYLFTFGKAGASAMGVAGFGVSRIISQLTGFLLITGYFLADKSIQRYKIFMPRKAALNYFKELMRLGSPLIFYSLIANGVSFSISMFIGKLGTLNTAIAQTADQYMAWIQMLGISVASGTCVPIAQSFGAGVLDDIRRYATIGTILGSTFYVIPLLVFSIFPMQLTRYFIKENIEQSSELIRVNFMFTLANNYSAYLKLMNTWNLSSIRENLTPTLITALIDIAITIPVAYGLSTVVDLTGINTGVFIGTSLAAGSLIIKWYRDTSSSMLPVKYEQMRVREENTAPSYFNQFKDYFSSGVSSLKNKFTFWSYSVAPTVENSLVIEEQEVEVKNDMDPK